MSTINQSVAQSMSPSQRKWLLMTGVSLSAILITSLSYWYANKSSSQSNKQSSKKRSRSAKPNLSDDQQVQREEVQLHGFANVGNTCFMNCIVQSLSSCDQFIEYLIDLKEYMKFNGINEPTAAQLVNQSINQYSRLSQEFSPLSLIDEMIAVLKGEKKDIQPFYDQLINQSIKQFRGRDQHDAHELFVTLLDLLQLRANQAMSRGADAKKSEYALDALIEFNEDEQQIDEPVRQTVNLDSPVSQTSTESFVEVSSESDCISQSTGSSPDADKSDEYQSDNSATTPISQSISRAISQPLSVEPPSPLESYSATFKFPVVTKGAESPCAPYMSCDQSVNRSINNFPPIDPFTGLTANSLICQTCHYSSAIRHTPFNTLSVAIPPSNHMTTVSLEQCLQVYCRREAINDFVCALCSATETAAKCQQMIAEAKGALTDASKADKTNAKLGKLSKRLKILSSQLEQINQTIGALKQGIDSDTLPLYDSPVLARVKARRAMVKQIMLARCPKLLCIHVNRLHGMEKLSTRVAFEEKLDLLPMTAHPASFYSSERLSDTPPIKVNDERPHPVYRLTSVVVHHGASGAGHFTAFRRHARYVDANNQSVNQSINQSPDADTWSHFSDDSVRPASWETVRRCEAYMLFYSKIS